LSCIWMSVLLETSLGTIVIDLYTTERPRCSLNFLKLCKIHYFNGCLFHNVQKNLVAQTGDPSGTGKGGSSIFEKLYGEQAQYFEREIKPKIHHKNRGTVSMVNNGHGQHGSQFFITLADNLDYLNRVHTVFGIVAEGEEWLSKINEVYCDKESRPYRNVRIHHTIVLDDPFPDPSSLEIPPSSPEFLPSYEELDIGPPRIEEDEELGEADTNLTAEELAEREAAKEARTNAQLLTLLGDLPDVDTKPPENVLFVCRLNPVTEAADLEVIFSRFGEITSCEVIRDRRTGASLQYAFIEFERKEDCEEAYFKMDNVVIDDRRIHVDFSQSVAKEWHRFRRQKYADAVETGASKGSQRHRPGPLACVESPRRKRQQEERPRWQQSHRRPPSPPRTRTPLQSPVRQEERHQSPSSSPPVEKSQQRFKKLATIKEASEKYVLLDGYTFYSLFLRSPYALHTRQFDRRGPTMSAVCST
uniref:Peptidyl-prolyl cis-trans isomerase n=1 Tax=Schistocephalus solidus TaxID=70667 RepID=A0A183T1J7_SCHSO